jgi:nitrogen fixation protein
MVDKKAKFIGIFANIPEKIREEDIIVVVDNKPFTWNSAVIEVKNDSEIGKKILKNLEKMGLL